MDNSTILQICKSIHESPGLNTSLIEEFKKKYPKLYAYVATENYDNDMLELILPYRNEMDTDNVGTNMKVAECIADKYLYNETTLKRPNEHVMNKHRERVRDRAKYEN